MFRCNMEIQRTKRIGSLLVTGFVYKVYKLYRVNKVYKVV